MERDDLGFLYPVGSILTHRALLQEPAASSPVRLFVVERLFQNCPGGVQRHYRCRAVSAVLSPDRQLGNVVQLHEEELAPLSVPSLPETMEALLAQLRSFHREVRDTLERAEELEPLLRGKS